MQSVGRGVQLFPGSGNASASVTNGKLLNCSQLFGSRRIILYLVVFMILTEVEMKYFPLIIFKKARRILRS